MKNIVTYGAPGVEISNESPSNLSKYQILFIVALPLLFLMAALLGRSVVNSLGPFISTNPLLSSIIGFILGILVFVIFIPKVLRMPKGKTTLREYLHTIGVDRIRPVSRTLLIFIPCLVSIAVTQIVASLVYNQFILGWEFDHFANQLFDSNRITNAIGSSPITAVGSIFEEIVLRGIVLTMLLQVYSKRKAIAGSAVTFGYVHILNLLNGPLTYELVTFVVGQIIWATIIGILYGYMFLITGNLYANMFLHWFANGMSNCFMYLPYVTPEIHALLNIVFNIGLMSTVISLCWIFLVNKYWPLTTQDARDVESLHEPSSKLSRSPILFIVAFPLVLLFWGLMSILVSTNPLSSSLIGFGILVYVLLLPKVLRMPKRRTTLCGHPHTIDVDRVRPVSRTNI